MATWVEHEGVSDWNLYPIGVTVESPTSGDAFIIGPPPAGTIVQHPFLPGEQAFRPSSWTAPLQILLTETAPGGGLQAASKVDGARVSFLLCSGAGEPPMGSVPSLYFDIVGYGRNEITGEFIELDRMVGTSMEIYEDSVGNNEYLHGDIRRIDIEPWPSNPVGEWYLANHDQLISAPAAPLRVWWYEPVSTVLHPTRQHPRSDGLGASSARRRFPASGSVQASARRFGTYT